MSHCGYMYLLLLWKKAFTQNYRGANVYCALNKERLNLKVFGPCFIHRNSVCAHEPNLPYSLH